ncbi:uncharacterized protein PHALS_14261 [Plasmopara halstedii]|uniref:Uncharacterized protein n=1 Tax=Plasmopara halstedii TaxID=4781 RepID=A0A0N7L6D7_PLAHL|nr:uncharacterized protein PHALS_14261 [Plasmopara halstedii]CEG43987.1 hypothetical protein PHALS_14261 [Plasmopara halstedii]|eukprot:XP_024580356.1 hypothetical protein PHALS_14261 [Plasmopara halstedii]
MMKLAIINLTLKIIVEKTTKIAVEPTGYFYEEHPDFFQKCEVKNHIDVMRTYMTLSVPMSTLAI